MKTKEVTELINRLNPNKWQCRACKKYKVRNSFPCKSFNIKVYKIMYNICSNCFFNLSVDEIDKALKNEN